MKYLGNLSAVEPVYSIRLECEKCQVEWIGCWDAAACPQCGDAEDFQRKAYQEVAQEMKENEAR